MTTRDTASIILTGRANVAGEVLSDRMASMMYRRMKRRVRICRVSGCGFPALHGFGECERHLTASAHGLLP